MFQTADLFFLLLCSEVSILREMWSSHKQALATSRVLPLQYRPIFHPYSYSSPQSISFVFLVFYLFYLCAPSCFRCIYFLQLIWSQFDEFASKPTLSQHVQFVHPRPIGHFPSQTVSIRISNSTSASTISKYSRNEFTQEPFNEIGWNFDRSEAMHWEVGSGNRPLPNQSLSMGITNDGQSLERTKCGSEFLITLALKSIAWVSFDCVDIILYRFPASRLSCYVFCTCLLTYNWKISWVERLICQNKWVGKAGWSELKSQNGEILKLPKKICSSLAAIHFVKVAPKKTDLLWSSENTIYPHQLGNEVLGYIKALPKSIFCAF